MRILGIETSCDETSAAIVEDGKRLLSVITATSLDLHAQYGGVVPEIAARSHIESIMPVINQALRQACTGSNPVQWWEDIDAIAVTYGAGLGGSLLIGVLAARTLAIIKKKPLYAINHVEGHVYANFLTSAGPHFLGDNKGGSTRRGGVASEDVSDNTLNEQRTPQHSNHLLLPSRQPEFPMLALIVSGGHTQLALFRDHFDYTLLGQTRDDAIGEAFDKVAKVIGLPYPGGPSIAKAATSGNPKSFSLPKAKMPEKYAFSFSGLKTAVLRQVQAMCGKDYDFPSFQLSELLNSSQKADIAATFQRVAIETVVDKTLQAYEEFQPASVVIAGGVAANQELRRQLTDRLPLPVSYTDTKLCTDNGAMIATLGYYKAMLSAPITDPYTLEIQPNLSM